MSKKITTHDSKCYNHFKKVIIFFQWFGLFPHSTEKGLRNDKLLFLSRFLILICVPLQFGMTVYHTVIFNKENEIDYASLASLYGERETGDTIVVNKKKSNFFPMLSVGTIIAYAAALIQSYFTRMEQALIFEKIKEIDNIFRFNLCMEPQNKTEKRNLIRRLIFTVLTSTLGSTLYAFSCTLTKPNLIIAYIATFTEYVYELKCLQLEIYLKMIDHRMKLMISYFSQNMKDDKTDVWNQQFSSVIKVGSSTIERLITLKMIYSKLWRVSVMLNNCFGWSLLIIVVIMFVSLTTNAYWLVLNLISDKSAYMMWYGKLINNCCTYFDVFIIWLTSNRKCFTTGVNTVHFITTDKHS